MSNKDIVSETDVKAEGISLVNHVHSGIYSGDSNTEVPVKEEVE